MCIRDSYVPAQTFKRQFVEATITTKKPELFFNYYQNIDLLLIDDIQEFSEAIKMCIRDRLLSLYGDP